MYGPFLTRSRNVDTAWRSIVGTVIEKGITVYTERKKQRTLECLGGMVHLTDWRTGRITPQDYIGLSPQVVENQYWPQYASAERGDHTYTYGWCMRKRFGFNQIQHVVEVLKGGANTAFAQFWNPITDSRSPDPPCIDIVMFQRTNGKVNMVEYIRSNDIARAWPEDVSGSYAVFLTEVAANFGGAVARGDMLSVMGSAHVYWTTLEEIRERFRSSYSGSNEKPVESRSNLFGPVIRVVNIGEKCSAVVQRVVDEYSQTAKVERAPIYLCLKVRPGRAKQAKTSRTRAIEADQKLGDALTHFEGKNDLGDPEIVDQINSASSKIRTTPESRRVVITPNNPWNREYSLNPVIIQFMAREGALNAAALYKDIDLENIDEQLELLLTVSSKVREEASNLRQGETVMVLAPIQY